MSPETQIQGQIAFVLKGYPRLSETFIAQEIHSLLGLGLDIAIYSLRHPTDSSTHPINDEIDASVNYLPEYLHNQPLRVLKGLITSFSKPGLSIALSTWWKDLKRDRSLNRIRRFGQALVLATELPANTTSIHAHFMHTPASVARYAAQILGLPWTCSAHAKDIWTSPEWELREKLNDCQWLSTCTASNVEYLSALSAKNNVSLNYHGIDIQRFPQAPEQLSQHDGSTPEQAVKLISVGRAVPKKGYFELLDAMVNIPPEQHWTFTHIGGGELIKDLKNHAKTIGIDKHCHWLGAQSQQVVLQHYRQADLFVLNCKIEPNGDRDGLPNVIVEAQSQSLAVLSTNISGIPELIENEINGILVEQQNTLEISAAISRLIKQPELRKNMGQAGYAKVRQCFDKDSNIEQLYALFMSISP